MNAYRKTFGTFVELASRKISLPPSQFPRLEKHSFAEEGRQILYPFLGELGFGGAGVSGTD